MKPSALYRSAAEMVFSERAHYGCTAIYALKRGRSKIQDPPQVFFRTLDIEALAFTQAFMNHEYPEDGYYTGVFGYADDPGAREHRVTALCLMAAVMEAQGM